MKSLPEMIKVEQVFDNSHIADIEKHTLSECEKFRHLFKPGEKIAIAAGSRGITNIITVLKTIISFLKNNGNDVIIFPAMGSHGGATAEGQLEILEGYGITEESMGVPIMSSMEVVELDSTGLENRVFIDKYAYECDGIIVANRIKAHTDHTAETESGLLKMCTIGIGKHAQAKEIHNYGNHGLKDLRVPSALRIIKEANVRLGFAIVENAYHQTAVLKALEPEDFVKEEIELLKLSNKIIARLPVKNIDILCIDEMGKNISGVGIDPNVTGEIGIRIEPQKNDTEVEIIIVDDLTDESHGNAIGVGLADMISEKLYNKIDFAATYENIITSSYLERGKIPMKFPTLEDCLETALGIRNWDNETIRLIRIKNTMELSEIYVSRAVYNSIKDQPSIKIPGDFVPWEKTSDL